MTNVQNFLLSNCVSRQNVPKAKNCKEYSDFAAIPVAEGVSTVQALANNTAYLSIMPDNFKRVTTISQSADIMYLINRSNVRKGELTKEQVKMFEDFVKEYSNKDRATLGSVYAKGYASPDGPVKFNDELSKARSESGQEAISKALEGVDAKYDIAAYGEDWGRLQRIGCRFGYQRQRSDSSGFGYD